MRLIDKYRILKSYTKWKMDLSRFSLQLSHRTAIYVDGFSSK